MRERERESETKMFSFLAFLYLCWRVIDGDFDGLAHCADVDHGQDVTITDLQKRENIKIQQTRDSLIPICNYLPC